MDSPAGIVLASALNVLRLCMKWRWIPQACLRVVCTDNAAVFQGVGDYCQRNLSAVCTGCEVQNRVREEGEHALPVGPVLCSRNRQLSGSLQRWKGPCVEIHPAIADVSLALSEFTQRIIDYSQNQLLPVRIVPRGISGLSSHDAAS
jgi:hypothetical protein